MYTSLFVKRTLWLAAFALVLVTFGTNAPAQEQATQGDETTTVPAGFPATDSLAMAPNDSVAIATEIQAIIKKEQSGFVYRMKQSGIGQNYVKGGPFMHPLLLCSIIGLVFIIERLWTLSRARANVRHLMGRVIKSLRQTGIQGALP